MSTMPSMNLFSTQLVANVGKVSKQQQMHTVVAAKPVMNLRSNAKVKMNIMSTGSKKPCGRCGGAK